MKYQSGQYLLLKYGNYEVYCKIVKVLNDKNIVVDSGIYRDHLINLGYFEVEIADIDEMQFKLLSQ
jgi:hypothetical protein